MQDDNFAALASDATVTILHHLATTHPAWWITVSPAARTRLFQFTEQTIFATLEQAHTSEEPIP